MVLPEPRARVRLTDPAVGDMHRLYKKDPQIVRAVIKKMLILERSPGAGKPLLGALVGFRKLVVGNRDFRIIWREITDQNNNPVVEIAEVWAVGVRADSEIYEEMTHRVQQLKTEGAPHAESLAEVVKTLGHFGKQFNVGAERPDKESLPPWMIQALRDTLQLNDVAISRFTLEEAQRLLAEHWSKPKD